MKTKRSEQQMFADNCWEIKQWCEIIHQSGLQSFADTGSSDFDSVYSYKQIRNCLKILSITGGRKNLLVTLPKDDGSWKFQLLLICLTVSSRKELPVSPCFYKGFFISYAGHH